MNSKKITRRKFIKDASKTLGLLAASSSFLFNYSCSTQKDELKIGYLPITDAAPLLIAYENNYFKEEKINAKLPIQIRSWSALVEAFLADKINIAHFLLPIPIWMRYSRNIPVKVIAWDHTNGSALTINKNSDIKNFSDLGGKHIAVPYWYSMHNVILQLGLRKYNLKPVIKSQSEKLDKNETNLFILPPPDMPIALAANKIDGYIVAEPFNALGESKIGAKIMRFTGDIWKNHPCCVIVVKDKLIKENPVFVQKITTAIARAHYWANNNRLKAAKILSKEYKAYLPVSESVLTRVFTGYETSVYGNDNIPLAIKHPEWNIQRIGFQPYPYPSATNFIYNQMKQTVVEGNKDFLFKYDSNFVVKDLVNYEFAKNSVNAIGGTSFFPEINIEQPWQREEIIEI